MMKKLLIALLLSCMFTCALTACELPGGQDSSTDSSSSSSTIATYTVKFVNDDGTVLQESTLEEGETPAYNGATPEKAATAEYTYTFSGWDSQIAPVTGNVTYTAQFSQTKNTYTVTFVVEGVETTQTLEYGATPVFDGTPTKEEDAQYSYTFSGWDTELAPVTGNATYTAQFTSSVKSYKITFVDEENNVLDTQEVAYGTVPSFNGTLPTKEATAEHTFTFVWDEACTAVTGEKTYTGRFTATVNKYTIKFMNDDGSVWKEMQVEYGTVPSCEAPSKEATADYSYTFAGWDVEPVAVIGDAIYTATYTATYIDKDTANRIGYMWGGSASTASIGVNTDAAGLYGSLSTQSIVINDFDISGYNDFSWQMGGYSGFSADIKVVLSSNAVVSSAGSVQVYDDGGSRIGVFELNAWTKLFSGRGNWGISFHYSSNITSSDGAPVSATIYLDNVTFYTNAEEAEAYRFAATAGALTQIANGDTSMSEWKGEYTVSIPNIAPSGESTHHNHAIVIKANVKDISNFDGISFMVDAKTWTGYNHHYFYIVPQNKVNGLTADIMDSFGQIQTTYAQHGLVRAEDHYLATHPNQSSGLQEIRITKAELIAAGYDITNLDTIVIAFRNSVWNTDASLGGTGWAAIGEIKFYDFKLY